MDQQEKPFVITNADLERLALEADTMRRIVDALKSVPEERRLPVLRAASVLTVGKDIRP